MTTNPIPQSELSTTTSKTSFFNFNRQHWPAVGVILLYVIASITYGLLSNGTWDDDCPTRYYNTLNALNRPKEFISLWNRPLFVLLFFIPIHLGKYVILAGMVLITSIAAWALYLGLQKMNIKNAVMVLPFLLFQAFYFGVSRNGLTEPLAVALICFGYFFFAHKNWIWFAIMGSLIPLARLELSVLLLIWAILLIQQKQFRLILVLGVPVFLWNLVGFIADGELLWLLKSAKGDGANSYGHQAFNHYFLRYIYVVGPVVFFFFFIGLWNRLVAHKFDLFVVGQCILGFMLYVMFGWKLNMGDSAGFLRNLIPISPMVAIIAVHGFNRWMDKISAKNEPIEIPEEQAIKPVAETSKPITSSKKSAPKPQTGTIKKEAKVKSSTNYVILDSLVLLVLVYVFYSKVLRGHHKLLEDVSYLNLAVSGVIFAVFVLSWLLFRKKMVAGLKAVLMVLVLFGSMAYTLVTEPWDAHMNPERAAMEEMANLWTGSYLKDLPTMCNHIWFYWSKDLKRNDPQFKEVLLKNLDSAEVGSLLIWETHYSNRLGADVPQDSLLKRSDLIELHKVRATDNSFAVVLYQKVKADRSDIMTWYDKFIASQPNMAEPLVNRGVLKMTKLNDVKGAITDFDLAIKIDPKLYDAYFNKGIAYFNAKSFSEAIVAFNQAVKQRANDADALYNIAVSYGNMGDIKNAIAAYDTLVKANVGYAKGYLNRALLYSSQKNTSLALADYSKVIELEPKNTMAYMNRGVMYSGLNDREKALIDFSKVVELEPNNVQGYFNLGVVQLQMNRKDIACKNFEKSRQLGHPQAGAIMQGYCGR